MINNPSTSIYSIYCITNLINGKKYIGFTSKSPPEKRMYSHCKKAKKSTISKAIQKYGKDNFTFEVILQGKDRDDVLSMETYFINEYNTMGKNGYNLTTGGDCPIFSKETRHKMAIAKINYIPWIKDKGHSAETKLKLSIKRMGTEAWNKGKKLSRGENNPNYGSKRTEEQKLNMSRMQKGRPSVHKGKRKYHNPKTKENRYCLPELKPEGYILGYYKDYKIIAF